MTDDTRDRVIRLEANLEHATAKIDDMQAKVNAMHDLLMQAKGMRWLIVGMAAVAGFIASFASKYLHLPLSK
ncbi:hypothetical protein [Bradyrhizobium sp. USDA 10063]